MDDPAARNAALPASFGQVPIDVTIVVGRARPLLRDLMRLERDAILPLDSKIDDPVEIYVGDRLIARGELDEIDGEGGRQLAVRLTEIAETTGGA